MHDSDTTNRASHRDNLLGICHALGAALGFDPNYLRVLVAALLLVSPQAALLGYALCGLIVLAERLVAWAIRPVARARD